MCSLLACRRGTIAESILARRFTAPPLRWPSTHQHRDLSFRWGLLFARELFVAVWEGYLLIREDRNHRFQLESDDGSRLYLDGTLLIDNWGEHSRRAMDAETAVKSGRHRIRIEYQQVFDDAEVEIRWDGTERDVRGHSPPTMYLQGGPSAGPGTCETSSYRSRGFWSRCGSLLRPPC